MDKMYLVDVLDGLIGTSADVYRAEIRRRGFTEKEAVVAEANWKSFRSRNPIADITNRDTVD